MSQAAAIRRFMEVWERPHEVMFLPGWGRETFYEPNVQKVLLERHPDNRSYTSPSHIGYPIHAWKIAEQRSLGGTKPLDHTELDTLDIMRIDAEWFSRLTVAVTEARQGLVKRTRHPQTILDKYTVWRNERFMFETSCQSPIDAPESYSHALPFIFGKQTMNQENALAAIRQAVFKEKTRRRGVMEVWAKCWLAELTLLPSPSAEEIKQSILGVTEKGSDK